MLKFYITLILTLVIYPTFGQEQSNWPSSLNYFTEGNIKTSNQICDGKEIVHRVVVSENFGKEYYYSGNLHAEGAITLINIIPVVQQNNKETIRKEYVRDGFWKVFADTSSQILQAAGYFEEGELNGYWTIYSKLGKPKYEFLFKDGINVNKIEINNDGRPNVVHSLNIGNFFVLKYEILLILLAVLPITLLRIGFNIVTYNKIHLTNYVPGFHKFQKGGTTVNLENAFRFWWNIQQTDKEEVKKYKKISNYISVFSLICVSIIAVLLFIYDPK